jgi:hypothetical protein
MTRQPRSCHVCLAESTCFSWLPLCVEPSLSASSHDARGGGWSRGLLPWRSTVRQVGRTPRQNFDMEAGDPAARWEAWEASQPRSQLASPARPAGLLHRNKQGGPREPLPAPSCMASVHPRRRRAPEQAGGDPHKHITPPQLLLGGQEEDTPRLTNDGTCVWKTSHEG